MIYACCIDNVYWSIIQLSCACSSHCLQVAIKVSSSAFVLPPRCRRRRCGQGVVSPSCTCTECACWDGHYTSSVLAVVHPQPPLGNCTLHLSKGFQKISWHGWLLLRSFGKHMAITKREWSHYNPSQFFTWDFFFCHPYNTWAIGYALHRPDMGSRGKPRQLQSTQTF